MRFSPFLANPPALLEMPRRPKPVKESQPDEENTTVKDKLLPKTTKSRNKPKTEPPTPTKIRVEKGDFIIEFK